MEERLEFGAELASISRRLEWGIPGWRFVNVDDFPPVGKTDDDPRFVVAADGDTGTGTRGYKEGVAGDSGIAVDLFAIIG